jgi:diacylglycerol kinase (ATP)
MPSNANNNDESTAAANALKSTGGFARIGKAFQYSMQGLTHAVRYEAAFRQELVIAIPAMIGLWFLPVSRVEKIVLLATVLLLLIVELLNSAIEATVDRVSTERHPLSGRAKDLGSAAVLFAVILMVTAWVLIAGPVLLRLFSG